MTQSLTKSALQARQFDLLVFDWDGTLMDSTGVIANAIQESCRDLGFDVPDTETASHVIGLGLSDAIYHILPDMKAQDYPHFVECYRHHFMLHDDAMPLFDGVIEMLDDLRARGFLLAIATGKARGGLERVLGKTGIGHFFHGSRCADEGFSKPHPGMLLYLMDELDVKPGRTLMIGDTTHDLQMAINAKTASIAVTYGAHPRQKLLDLNPLGCFDQTSEMHAWLLNHA